MLPPLVAPIEKCVDGYLWVEDSGLRELPKEACVLLIPNVDDGSVILHEPLKARPFLFLEFAELEPTREAFLAFANEHGALEFEDGGWNSLFHWTQAHERMRSGVDLWLGLREHDRERLRPYVRWEGSKLRIHSPFWERGRGCPKSFLEQPFEKREYKRGDVESPAIDLLDWTIARQMHGVCLEPVRHSPKVFSFVIHQGYLDKAMWIQFVKAVEADAAIRRCEFCNRPFSADAQDNRRDHVFCRDACRVKAYRRRRTKALELHRIGTQLKTIAQEVGSDIGTVREWLKKGQG